MRIRATYRVVWSSNAKTLYLLPSLIVSLGADPHNGRFIHFRFLVFWFCVGFFKKIKSVTDFDRRDISPPPPPKPQTLTDMIFKNQNEDE